MQEIAEVGTSSEVAVAEPRSLGDGLVLRWSTPDDVEGIAEGAARVFREGPDKPLSPGMLEWMRELGSGRHALTDANQAVLVEDTRAGKIVAGTWLIPTRWSYGGITFGVGRPEAVWSDPEYRNRGLVRAIFDAFHARSAANGDLAQGITGIPYYYRQFGYEFAIPLGGGRTINLDAIPPLKEGETDSYTLRPAAEDDLPFVIGLHERDEQRALATSVIDQAYWRMSIERGRSNATQSFCPVVITNAENTPCGYALTMNRRWGKALGVVGLGLADGYSLVTMLRPILRGLRDLAQTIPPHQGAEPPSRLTFPLGVDHPLMPLLDDGFNAVQSQPYAWYVRVPDLPRFIRHIAPVLEGRLTASVAAGYRGELTFDFYRDGLRLVFEQGRLTLAEPWKRPVWGKGPSAGFPPLVFLQVLFGRATIEELGALMPDVWASDEAKPVLRALFPKMASDVIPLD